MIKIFYQQFIQQELWINYIILCDFQNKLIKNIKNKLHILKLFEEINLDLFT